MLLEVLKSTMEWRLGRVGHLVRRSSKLIDRLTAMGLCLAGVSRGTPNPHQCVIIFRSLNGQGIYLQWQLRSARRYSCRCMTFEGFSRENMIDFEDVLDVKFLVDEGRIKV